MIDFVNLNDAAFPLTCQILELRAVAPHYHDNLVVLVIVLEGKVVLHAGGLHRELKEGEMAFINTGEVHYTEDGRNNKVLVVHADAKGDFYRNSCAFEKSEYADLKINLLSITYAYYMDELIDENEYRIICDNIAEMIKSTFNISAKKLAGHIQNNYMHRMSGIDVADATGLNSKAITAMLKKEGLGTFSDYLRYVRCTVADKLLVTSKIKINVISDLAGFSSVRSFIRDFTVYSGRTPLQQRKYYKEISKHKFNRTMDVPNHQKVEILCQYAGNLYMRGYLSSVL